MREQAVDYFVLQRTAQVKNSKFKNTVIKTEYVGESISIDDDIQITMRTKLCKRRLCHSNHRLMAVQPDQYNIYMTGCVEIYTNHALRTTFSLLYIIVPFSRHSEATII